jgi:hypothetical protein
MNAVVVSHPYFIKILTTHSRTGSLMLGNFSRDRGMRITLSSSSMNTQPVLKQFHVNNNGKQTCITTLSKPVTRHNVKQMK